MKEKIRCRQRNQIENRVVYIHRRRHSLSPDASENDIRSGVGSTTNPVSRLTHTSKQCIDDNASLARRLCALAPFQGRPGYAREGEIHTPTESASEMCERKSILHGGGKVGVLKN